MDETLSAIGGSLNSTFFIVAIRPALSFCNYDNDNGKAESTACISVLIRSACVEKAVWKYSKQWVAEEELPRQRHCDTADMYIAVALAHTYGISATCLDKGWFRDRPYAHCWPRTRLSMLVFRHRAVIGV
jgi:hypothetical protein